MPPHAVKHCTAAPQEVTNDEHRAALTEQLRQFAAMRDATLRAQGFIAVIQQQRTAASRGRPHLAENADKTRIAAFNIIAAGRFGIWLYPYSRPS